MQLIDGRLLYAASDLNNYLECKRLTELDALVARRKLPRPQDEDDAQAQLLRRKGEEHEQRFLEAMQAHYGDAVVCFTRPEASVEAFALAERQTRAAMASGAPIVYQATFFDGQFIGHADFLRRIQPPSALGPWSYEVLDTKLALRPKPYYLVQLCNYSAHVERLQGLAPVHGHIVLGNNVEKSFQLHDYVAYYRHLKAAFLAFAGDAAHLANDVPIEYPLECEHCKMCAWDAACRQQRIDDDHLSLVAWIRRDQIAKFEEAGIVSVAALAAASDESRPKEMGREIYQKLRRQAAIQVRGRSEGPIYELLHHERPMGFGLMSEAAPGDVFFDMEGDPYYEPGRGLEYLFGCWMPDDEPRYRPFLALDRAEEKRRFEEFVDFIAARRRAHPAMHVYHYASYEKVALRRLAQEHCTREDAVDDLLRGEVLVDLYPVVRQALLVSKGSYGLKGLEDFYGLKRETGVKKGDESIVMFERWRLERDPNILADITEYNRNDCLSTYMLREWLFERRREAMSSLGLNVPLRPVKMPGEPCHAEFVANCPTCEARQKEEREERRLSELERYLLADASDDARTHHLLAHLLAYHRREEKPEYWAYFDRRENVDRLLEDGDAIFGLSLREDVPPEIVKRSYIYTYRFPVQPYKLWEGDTPHDPSTEPYKTAGKIVGIDEDRRELRLKRTGSVAEARAVTALIPRHPLPTDVQRKALKRIAELFAAGRLVDERRATFDLLTARDPRLTGIPAGAVIQPERVTPATVSAIVRSLDRSYVFIQGPPGSGKTTTGAGVICDLLQLGKRVGVSSTGHKAIHNLLNKIELEMAERGARFRGLYKFSNDNLGSKYDSPLAHSFVEATHENKGFDDPEYQLAAGTSWLFARDELVGRFDYLFIDEAGQVSLADAIAVSACAENVVLLGDPSQLAQVSQGVHPERAGYSVLQHLLCDEQTIPPHRGIFLDVSYRMQPEICAFISDAMYDSRLKAAPETALHHVTVGGEDSAGLYYLPVEHAGNSSSSPEEAARIVREIQLILQGTFVDSRAESNGVPRPISSDDVIVVTPYNAQRRLIARKLVDAGIHVRVGTVDKFQGQEAPVVFYSMATSAGENVPRDLQFLFERNRFNVAISRARAMSVLVCSPRLLDVDCRTPEQMALVNLLCAFAEAARRDKGYVSPTCKLSTVTCTMRESHSL